MVWAKSRMVIRDYIFEPRRNLYLMWSGRIPSKICIEIYHLLQEIFSVPESHIMEMVSDWETKEGNIKFKVGWRVIKEFDIYSYLRFDINIAGKIDKSGYGTISIAMKPRFFTEYPQDNIFQQTILYEILRRIWHVVFYEKKIFQYKEESRILVMEFNRRLKELLESYSITPPQTS